MKLDFRTKTNVQPLFIIRGADMQSTADQAFVKQGSFTNYTVGRVLALRVTGGTTVACAGGIYTSASKAGNALVATAQSWVALSGAGKTVDATIAAIALTDIQTATPFFSLTTGSTAAATADIYIFGFILD